MHPVLKGPVGMLGLGSAGMLAGFGLDAAGGGLDRLAALCAAQPPGWDRLLGWHWSELPLAHAGMLLAGFAAGPNRLLSSGAMLLGMTLGACLAAETAGTGAAALLGGMWLGMAGAMAVVEVAATLARNPTSHCRTRP